MKKLSIRVATILALALATAPQSTARAGTVLVITQQSGSVTADASAGSISDSHSQDVPSAGPFDLSVDALAKSPDDQNSVAVASATQHFAIGVNTFAVSGTAAANGDNAALAFGAGTNHFHLAFNITQPVHATLIGNIGFNIGEPSTVALKAEVHSPLFDFGPAGPSGEGGSDTIVVNEAGLLQPGAYVFSFDGEAHESFDTGNSLDYSFTFTAAPSSIPLPASAATGAIGLALLACGRIAIERRRARQVVR